jgi:hypothetical protein
MRGEACLAHCPAIYLGNNCTSILPGDQGNRLKHYHLWLVFKRCPFRISADASTVMTTNCSGFISSEKLPGLYPVSGHDCCLSHPFQFIIHTDDAIRCHASRDADSVLISGCTLLHGKTCLSATDIDNGRRPVVFVKLWGHEQLCYKYVFNNK